jgi:glycosyltransferase involved in cell wall biosynthesis
MFSVIIPVYNKSAYIEKCLQSVLNQTNQDFEVIIVNDGSTDGSAEKVEKFKVQSSKVKVISHPNSGVSTARNNGARAAKYDYLAFLDADDWWDIHFLEEMKGLIENCPDAGLYGSNYFYVKNGINRVEDKGLTGDFTSGYIDYIKLYRSTFCVPLNCSFVVVPKTVFFEAEGFNQALKFGEDFDLWVRLALNHKVAYINKPLAYSNQDLPVDQRAVGNKKLFNPANHFIFNLGYLDGSEKTNPELKMLFDGLRVRSLQQYYLSGLYSKEVNNELHKVDFKSQPAYYRYFYNSPKFLIRFLFSLRIAGSRIKQGMIKLMRNNNPKNDIRYQINDN